MTRTRRPATALILALVAVLLAATGVALDRLRGPGDAMGVVAIEPSYTFMPVAAPAKVAAKPKAPKVVKRPAAAKIACPGLPRVGSSAAVAAKAVVPRVKVYDRPDGRVSRVLTNPTVEGQPLHALVHERQGVWLKIQLVSRPNGATGWVRITNFAQYQTPYRIVVQRCSRKLTVLKFGQPVWERPVAVGKASTPTPAGDFFVDFITPMRCCAYGPVMLSVSGFSNVIFQFGKNGTGQIAIHGTNADWSVGSAASNGCIRMHNADVTALSKMVPAGTPVTIVD
ncbi:MAG TPA: L,D-transpeptidase [Frankiaceae bacterium]|nr:L,D-transpeptidase [Frankiaceae bacterium]